jgi:hypothetical protein
VNLTAIHIVMKEWYTAITTTQTYITDMLTRC